MAETAATPRLRRRRLYYEAALVIFTTAAAVWFGSQVRDIFWASPFTDFDILFHSAYQVTIGQSPYDVTGLRQAPFGPYYKFPPLVDIILARFTGYPWMQVAQVYAAIGLVLYLACFLLLIRTEGIAFRSVPFYLLAIVFLVFQPALDTLYGAQHEFVILTLFALAYWGLHQGRKGKWLAGASIAAAALIKIYPVLLLPYFLLRRLWGAAISFVVTAGGLTAISILLAGWELQRQFWFEIFPALSGGTAWLENQSFFGFFSRLFVNGATVNPALVTRLPAASFLSSAAGVIALCISFWALLRESRPEVAFSILIPLMLLFSPDAWIHYETLLLLPFAILLARFAKGASPWQWLGLLVAAVLVAYGNEDTVMGTTSGLLQSYKFFGVLLFWGLGLVGAWNKSALASWS